MLFLCSFILKGAGDSSGEHGGAVERGAHGVAGQRVHHRVPVLAQRVPTEARRAAALHGA